jgi:CheY-like chemotaxis protein
MAPKAPQTAAKAWSVSLLRLCEFPDPMNGAPCARGRAEPKFTFAHLYGTEPPRSRYGVGAWIVRGRGVTVLEDRLILVVEDDQEIQSIVEDALTDGGYAPAIAPSGEEAVTLLKGNRGRYRALIADIGLRGRMTGWEVASCAREIDPEFPVLYLTGAFAHQWESRGVSYSLLLTKPFVPSQLVTAVSQLLNGGAPTT